MVENPVFVAIISGLTAATAVAALFYSIFSDLKKELKKLEEERVVKLENRVEYHINSDCSQRVLAKIETILEEQTKMSAKLDRYAEETSKQSAQIAANDKYIDNLDKSFERHKVSGGHH